MKREKSKPGSAGTAAIAVAAAGVGLLTGLAARAANHPEFAQRLCDLLRSSGLPVTHVAARKTPIGPDYFENEDEQRQVVSALLGYPDAFVQTHDGELIAEREGNYVDLFLTSLQIGLRGPGGRDPGLDGLGRKARCAGLRRLPAQ